jgi:hypothetical protein
MLDILARFRLPVGLLGTRRCLGVAGPGTWPHDVAVNEVGLGTGEVWPNDDPTCRVVRNAWTGEIEGIGVWNPSTWTYDVVRPTGTFAAEIRETFARLIAEGLVEAIWPVSGTMRPPASPEELFTIAEALLDPGILVAKLAGAVAEVAALHAGFPPVVARVIGQAVQDWFHALLSQDDPDVGKERAVQYFDFTFSATTGSLINCSALHQTVVDQTADAITKLLGPDGRRYPRGSKPRTTGYRLDPDRRQYPGDLKAPVTRTRPGRPLTRGGVRQTGKQQGASTVEDRVLRRGQSRQTQAQKPREPGGGPSVG